MPEYENFRVTSFYGTHTINDKWPSAPPVDLDISTLDGFGTWRKLAGRVGSALGTNPNVTTLNLKDNPYVLRYAVFSNFADGLVLQQKILSCEFGLELSTDTSPKHGTVAVAVPLLNTWFETNVFINQKDAVFPAIGESLGQTIQNGVDGGTINPAVDTLSIFARIDNLSLGFPIYSTVQINPALANIVDEENPPAGTANIMFDIVMEVRHTYGI